MIESLPTLYDLGGSRKFDKWWPNQADAILRAIDSPKRFVALCCPTGFGKSPVAIGRGVLTGARTIYLTSSKGLQDQLVDDFTLSGLVDIRGQQNYTCIEHQNFGIDNAMSVSTAPCHSGVVCPSKESTCHYYKAVREAKNSNLVESNYPYWILQNMFGDGLGTFDLMVCDEAHEVVQELCSVLSTTIQKHEVEAILNSTFPTTHAGVDQWRQWATVLGKKLELAIGEMKVQIQTLMAEGEYGQAHQLGKRLWERKDLKRRLDTLGGAKGEWVAEMHGEGMVWDPVWPQQYAEQMLFWSTPKVVLMSATMNRKTMQLLGIPEDQYEFIEYDSTFPLERRPVYYLPIVRLNKDSDESDYRAWIVGIDQIARDRVMGRKGIVHTVSYKRAKMVLEQSDYREHMISHTSRNTRGMVEVFRKSNPPCTLISPVMDTGWDFPGNQLRWAIMGKLPWPDTRSAVMRARVKFDPEYVPYLVVQTLEQTYGRGVRYGPHSNPEDEDGDWCEFFVIDSLFGWFISQYGKMMAQWFRKAIRKVNTIPPPLNF